jgi:hypothetical protein
MAYGIGLTGPYPFTNDIQSDFFAASMLWYVNRVPLITRLPNVGTSAVTVNQVDDAYRPKSQLLGADMNLVETSITLTDVSYLQLGDVLEVGTEHLRITGSINTTGNTVTVERAANSTTAANHTSGDTTYLVSNTRTGAEVDQDAGTAPFTVTATTPQTIQEPYQIGGSLEASSGNMAIPMGYGSLVGYERAKAMQENLFGFERAAYYGRYAAVAANTTRPMMRGIKQRLTTNKVTSPTNASAYKPSDFVRDVIAPGLAGGGQVDAILCSEDYRTGFAVWGLNMTQVRQGDNALGIDVRTFTISGVNAQIIFAPLLRSGTAIGLTSEEVVMGWKREPFDKPRGSRGDATEGDVIGEGCIVLNNEAHHTWTEGVTGFAKQS